MKTEQLVFLVTVEVIEDRKSLAEDQIRTTLKAAVDNDWIDPRMGILNLVGVTLAQPPENTR